MNNPMTIKTPIGRLRIMAICEGVSYLLFGVTMPLKYLMDIPQPNYVVGMAHGIFFIVYLYLCLLNAMIYKWSYKNIAIGLVASLVPFATFYADHAIFKMAKSPGA